ncbi:MAG: DUF349 domain-containing protein [Propionibacteriaceae bacterium]|nr:DUF349 domain-containing protein [Propionibacteriaceae bacterium]
MSDSHDSTPYGRVEPDGTVFVRLSTGERQVGQVSDVEPSEALAFFERRFQGLEGEVSLLMQRVNAGALSPDEARKAIATLSKNVLEANAVGDLEGLAAKLEALVPKLDEQAEARRAERARQQEEAKTAKEAMVAEAEKLAEGNDWRGGINRFRALLDAWKALPRVNKATDDELWKRFSAARTTYTRRRKAQMAEFTVQYDAAKKAKQQIIAEAEPLASSTDWGPTAGAFRDLMTRWKAAGSADHATDEALWKQFRALQDQFFDARTAAQNEQDNQFKANLVGKEALLDEAEKTLLPVTDAAKARTGLREMLLKYNQFGMVPRSAIHSLDDRLRAIESAIREAEEEQWRRTDPQARRRAQDTVDMFTNQIDKLARQADAAEKKGDTKRAETLRESIKTYTLWRDQAAKALEDFRA